MILNGLAFWLVVSSVYVNFSMYPISVEHGRIMNSTLFWQTADGKEKNLGIFEIRFSRTGSIFSDRKIKLTRNNL